MSRAHSQGVGGNERLAARLLRCAAQPSKQDPWKDRTQGDGDSYSSSEQHSVPMQPKQRCTISAPPAQVLPAAAVQTTTHIPTADTAGGRHTGSAVHAAAHSHS